MFRVTLMSALLFASSLLGQMSSVLHDAEDRNSPGLIRLLGVTRADTVRLDGEVVDAAGLERSRYNLLIAPGTYTISIKLADSGKTCVSEITVEPNETVAARCMRRPIGEPAD